MAKVGPVLYPGVQTVTTSFAGLFPGTTDYPGSTDYPGGAISPASDLYPGAATFPGQGNLPLIRARYSTDDVLALNPTWADVAYTDFRAFSTSRGRGADMEEFSAGSGTATFGNRGRAFDPLSNPSIRPLNRIWIFEEFSGETHDILKGYVASWDLNYAGGAWADATVTANITDEFIVLSSLALSTTNPPRETYQDLVMSDQPFGYWDMNEDPAGIAYQPIDTSSPQAPDAGTSLGLVQFRRHDRRAIPGKPRKHG